jgi:hypothetical protein
MEHFGFYRTGFLEILCFGFVLKFIDTSQIFVKTRQKCDILRRHLRTCMISRCLRDLAESRKRRDMSLRWSYGRTMIECKCCRVRGRRKNYCADHVC